MITILIDESGDPKVDNVKEDPSYGPTQYFTMCAAVFSEENREVIEAVYRDLPWNRERQKQAKNLGHFDKIHACSEISNLPVALLGVASNKLTLGEYLPEAIRTPTHF